MNKFKWINPIFWIGLIIGFIGCSLFAGIGVIDNLFTKNN